jgi:hypothetical protein
MWDKRSMNITQIHVKLRLKLFIHQAQAGWDLYRMSPAATILDPARKVRS